jgi:hypothetical protein
MRVRRFSELQLEAQPRAILSRRTQSETNCAIGIERVSPALSVTANIVRGHRWSVARRMRATVLAQLPVRILRCRSATGSSAS